MIVLASEDIGNADPRALLVAVAAAQAVEHVGLPEARLNLAQAAIYLARAPKSNASYVALKEASADVREHGQARPPDSLRDTHYYGAKKLGRGKGYVFGAFCPATGAAFTRPYPGRGAVNWVAFLEEVEGWLLPEAERVYGIYREFCVWGGTMLLKEPSHAAPQTACHPG